MSYIMRENTTRTCLKHQKHFFLLQQDITFFLFACEHHTYISSDSFSFFCSLFIISSSIKVFRINHITVTTPLNLMTDYFLYQLPTVLPEMIHTLIYVLTSRTLKVFYVITFQSTLCHTYLGKNTLTTKTLKWNRVTYVKQNQRMSAKIMC